MGGWLSRFFHGQGHSVATFDPAGRLEGFAAFASLGEGLAWAEIAIVATPLESARETLGAVLALRPRALVADIFSLKTPVVPIVRDGVAAGLRVASIHPLFGPDAVLLAGRTLLVCDTGDPGAAREIRSFFAPTSLAIHAISLEDHDRAMAVVLGLSHAVNLIFARALLKTGRTFADLGGVASTTFWKQARTAMEVAAENPRLYHAIQHENRESARTLPLLLDATREFVEAALASDPGPFVSEMERARAWFAKRPRKGQTP
jgi:chorismate mutase/prephenate dehydrogenase